MRNFRKICLPESQGIDFSKVCPKLTALVKKQIQDVKLVASGASAAYLRQLNEAVSKPEELAKLATWMNENDLAMMVSDWSAALSGR